MSHMLAMLVQGEADTLTKAASAEVSIFGRVAGALAVAGLEKQASVFAKRFRPMREDSDPTDFLNIDSPVLSYLREYMRDHPPENIQQLRDLYAQATERALQSALSSIETSETADPMGLALKNLRRMADLLETRLDTLRAQREIQQFQRELAVSQGLSPTNPATQAVTELPAQAAPPPEVAAAVPADPGGPPALASGQAPSPPAGTEPPAPPSM